MMYLIGKLATAMRGGTREVLEAAVDANALRILDQEIHECEDSLRQSRQHLAEVMAEKLRLQRQLDAARKKMASKEDFIRSRLERQDEAGALELADELAQQEDWLENQQAHCDQLHDYEQRLLKTLKSTTFKLEQYRAELRMSQATRRAQQVAGKLSRHANTHGDSFARMQDSLERIRQQHETFDDRMQAMQQIDSYMAGEAPAKQRPCHKAEDVLARLRAA